MIVGSIAFFGGGKILIFSYFQKDLCTEEFESSIMNYYRLYYRSILKVWCNLTAHRMALLSEFSSSLIYTDSCAHVVPECTRR